MSQLLFDPRTMPMTEFVEGSNDVEVIIDDVFAKPLGSILEDHRESDPESIKIHNDAVVTVSALNKSFRFVGVDAGILMLCGDEIVGAYLGFDVALDPARHGQGLGAELVLERAMRDGGVPQWEASKIGYSRAGYRAHKTAWEMAGDRELFARKAARLILADLRVTDITVHEARTRAGVPASWTAEDWLVQDIHNRGLPAVVSGIWPNAGPKI